MNTKHKELCRKYEAWLNEPAQARYKVSATSADELIHEPDLTVEQRTWLANFIMEWEDAE